MHPEATSSYVPPSQISHNLKVDIFQRFNPILEPTYLLDDIREELLSLARGPPRARRAIEVRDIECIFVVVYSLCMPE